MHRTRRQTQINTANTRIAHVTSPTEDCTSMECNPRGTRRTPVPSLRGRRAPPAGLGPAGITIPQEDPATDGVVRRRMRWTVELNISVMRAYYKATKGGTNLTSYRPKMLCEFQQLQPNLTNLTAQRLSDQVRVILSRKILDDRLLEQLCSEYSTSTIDSIPDSQRTLPGENDELNISDRNHNVNITNLDHETVERNSLDIDVSSQDNEYIRRTFECSLLEYKNIPIENRPKLPKLRNNRKTILTVASINIICKDYFENSNSILETMSLLYCCAHAVCIIMNIPLISVQNFKKNKTEPKWKQRIQTRIDNTRKIIGKLISYQTGNRRKKIINLVNQIANENNISQSDPCFRDKITEYIDTLKQKLKAWANRIRRYSERSKRYFQNRTFESNQKRMYRSWENTATHRSTDGRPSLNECLSFWKSMWSSEVSHDEGEWIRATERACSNLANMGPISITAEDIYSITRRLHNWKSPGPDGIHNFWLKWITSSHARLAAQIQEAIECCELPRLLTTGITHLIYKNGNTAEPKNYRPITCLSTVYKLITAILNNKIYKHLENNNIISTTQNGCRKGSRGCKELLLIDTAICRQVFRNRKNMSAAWVDYKKAYDSVPHSWLKRVLEIYKIDDNICKFLSKLMGQWNTVLNLPGEWQSSSIDSINIKRGIFQGDSLSPTWFCLALNPLSTALEASGLGFRFRKDNSPISHLLYMDDLKLFTSKESDLLLLLKLTHSFNNDIRMEFGIDKCAVIHVKRGKIKNSNNFEITNELHFSSLSETETYKYLGMAEALGINDQNIKENSKEKFMSRLNKVIKSHLSGGNKIRAYNSWVIPSLLYSFGVTRWTQTELDALDRRVRTLMTTHRMHHPRSSVMRLYLPRKDGGRGLLNIKNLHNREVYNLRHYFITKKDASRIHSDVVINDKSLTPLNMSAKDWQRPHTMSIVERKKVWNAKQLHGRFFKILTNPDVDMVASVHWLRFGDLFAETEGFVCAIQDEVIKTNNYRKYILKDGTTDVCRACHRPGESLRHVISGCPQLSNGEYLHRHNQVARIIHQQLAIKFGFTPQDVPYYKYEPKPVLENRSVTLYWDRSIITDRFIVANKPDIVVVDRTTRKAIIVDISVPHDENLLKAENDKKTKYIDLAHEIVAMWDVDSTIVVPIVVSVNGLIGKNMDDYLSKLGLGKWLKGLIQKAALLNTARIVRRFLSLDA